MLPDKVKVGAFWYGIRVASKEEEELLKAKGRQAECDYVKLEITLSPILTGMSQRESLLHEILHANCRDRFMPGDTTSNEVDIYLTSMGLFQIMVDNPEVVRFIAGLGEPAAGPDPGRSS